MAGRYRKIIWHVHDNAATRKPCTVPCDDSGDDSLKQDRLELNRPVVVGEHEHVVEEDGQPRCVAHEYIKCLPFLRDDEAGYAQPPYSGEDRRQRVAQLMGNEAEAVSYTHL